jgi:DNA polymerase-3 subunit chi
MARIDFYILNQAGQHSRQTFACRLAEKAYSLNNSVHIHAASRDDAERLDELLWTFRDGSFVPHERISDTSRSPEAPVTIGCDDETVEVRDLLINLSDEIPACAGGFPRVAELVTSDDDCKQLSRKRFATYRAQGHSLETHNV